MPYLDDLAVFAKVVDRNSFSAVARELETTKSSISKQIGRLERRLDAKLLNRSTRRLSLTEIGALVYDHCTRIADEAQQIEALVAGLQSKPKGVLRITTSVAFGNLHLVGWLPEFTKRHPEVEVRVHLNDRTMDLVEEGFDVAVRLTSSPPALAVARRLGVLPYVVCASPSYLRKAGTPKEPAALSKFNCLRFDQSDRHAHWHFSKDGTRLSVKVTGNMTTNTSESLRAATLAGGGVALLPTYAVAEDLHSGKLRRLLSSYQVEGSFGDAVYAVYLPNRFLAPKVRAFIDFLVEKIGEPDWEREGT